MNIKKRLEKLEFDPNTPGQPITEIELIRNYEDGTRITELYDIDPKTGAWVLKKKKVEHIGPERAQDPNDQGQGEEDTTK